MKWQTEAMYRRFEAGRGVDETFPVAETFHDWGMYSQVALGIPQRLGRRCARRLRAHEGFAFHRRSGPANRARASAPISPGIRPSSRNCACNTITIFSKQNFFLAGRQADSVFLQFEFILGAHGAHKF